MIYWREDLIWRYRNNVTVSYFPKHGSEGLFKIIFCLTELKSITYICIDLLIFFLRNILIFVSLLYETHFPINEITWM